MKEKYTEYSISDYRTTCRSCKDMDSIEWEKQSKKVKKKYKDLIGGTPKQKPQLNMEEAWKNIEQSVKKVPKSAKRYTEEQLRDMECTLHIKIILILQDENDRLRSEVDALRLKIELLDKRGE